MEAIEKVFGRKLQELRKERGWTQRELAEALDTSPVVIGRYERGEMTPSIKVAQKVAEVFGVTIDHLASSRDLPPILGNQEMLGRWKEISDLPDDDRDRIIFVIDSLIRETKTRLTFAVTG